MKVVYFRAVVLTEGTERFRVTRFQRLRGTRKRGWFQKGRRTRCHSGDDTKRWWMSSKLPLVTRRDLDTSGVIRDPRLVIFSLQKKSKNTFSSLETLKSSGKSSSLAVSKRLMIAHDRWANIKLNYSLEIYNMEKVLQFF